MHAPLHAPSRTGFARRLPPLAALGGLAIAAAPPAAPAPFHEHRDVADERYTMVVGFLEEPAVADDVNGLSLAVEAHEPHAHGDSTPGGHDEHEAGTPVEGLEDSLEAEVIYGDQSMELELKAQYGKPGAYVAYFIPTAAGDYAFRLHGEIDGTPIDETFAPSPDEMRPVAPREALEFPKRLGSSGA